MRFVFLTDTHFGDGIPGYYQQIPYHNKINSIMDALKDWIKQDGNIDFVMHGGDMIHECSAESLKQAVDLFQFDMPFYHTLGNHDLDVENSLELWLEHAPHFFNGGKPEYSLEFDGITLHSITSHYGEDSFFWGPTQDFRFDPPEHEKLIEKVAKPGIHIVVVHVPAFGIPAVQMGTENEHHPIIESYNKDILALREACPNLACVLSGHLHINSCKIDGDTAFVTCAALTESPFEFKVVEIDEKQINMQTISLIDQVDFKANYDFEKTSTQGRPIDRNFSFEF